MEQEKTALKVLVAHPSSELYGTDRVLLESVDGFLERGWKVLVTVPVDGPLIPELERRGIPTVQGQTPVLRKSLMSPTGLVRLLGGTITGAIRGLQLIRQANPDVIYVNTITIPLWPVLGRLTRTPVLTHVHEAEGSAPRMLRAALATPLLLANAIVANSRYSAELHAKSLPLLEGRAQVIYNGVPGPGTPSPARVAISGPLRVLYVGRLSWRKGVDVAVDAVAELRKRGVPAVLDVVGAVYPGYEDYEQGLRTSVDRQGLQDAVTFHGFHEDVSAFRQACDVAVVTSRLDEPFGNTAVETLLAGRPLVVSDTSGLREAAAGYGSAQFVQPGDMLALADALEKVRQNWESFAMSANADAAAADRKHSPASYRTALSDAVAAVVGTRR
jgi:glycosyltransferase involved in cell wall biosynthesis